LSRRKEYWIIDLDMTKTDWQYLVPYKNKLEKVVVVGDFDKYKCLTGGIELLQADLVHRRSAITHKYGMDDIIEGWIKMIAERKEYYETSTLVIATWNTERYNKYKKLVADEDLNINIKIVQNLRTFLRRREKRELRKLIKA